MQKPQPPFCIFMHFETPHIKITSASPIIFSYLGPLGPLQCVRRAGRGGGGWEGGSEEISAELLHRTVAVVGYLRFLIRQKEEERSGR